MKILQNFVAFSEYINFTCQMQQKQINTYLTTVFNSEAALTVMMAMNFETEENPI